MSVTEFTGPRSLPPAPPRHAPERALIAWTVFLLMALAIALSVALTAREHYREVPEPVPVCDLSPVHSCVLHGSHGDQMIVYEGAGALGLATMTPPAKGN